MSRRFRITHSSKSRSSMVVATLAIVLVGTSGCVQRRMTVRSNVPGAQVYVDNYEIGRTPVSTDFVYYGARDIRLVKDGYETLKVKQPLNAPWYQYPGLDFVFENIWPFELRDERNFNYQMQPQYMVPTETILSRAEEMRLQNVPTMTPVAQPVAGQPMLGQPVPGQPVAGQPAYGIQPGSPVPPGYSTPAYTIPPGGATGPVVAPGYPAQPSPYAPQPTTGAPRL